MQTINLGTIVSVEIVSSFPTNKSLAFSEGGWSLVSCINPSRNTNIPYDPDSRSEDGTEEPRRWQVDAFTGYEGKVRAEFDEKPLDRYNVIILLPRVTTINGRRLSGFYEKIGVGVIHNQAVSWAVRSAPSQKEFWIL